MGPRGSQHITTSCSTRARWAGQTYPRLTPKVFRVSPGYDILQPAIGHSTLSWIKNQSQWLNMAGPDLDQAAMPKQILRWINNSTVPENLALCLPLVLTYFRGSVRKMGHTECCPHSESQRPCYRRCMKILWKGTNFSKLCANFNSGNVSLLIFCYSDLLLLLFSVCVLSHVQLFATL